MIGFAKPLGGCVMIEQVSYRFFNLSMEVSLPF